jgi:hypothetical protein
MYGRWEISRMRSARAEAREPSCNGIASLERVARHSREELLASRGVGPKAIRILEGALAAEGLGYNDA